MSVVERLVELGGTSSWAALTKLTSRGEVERALAAGDIQRVSRGRYALPHVDEGKQAAHALNGVLSHSSAALAWGWELKVLPDWPHVTVPVKRKVSAERRRKVHLHRADLHGDDVVDGVTSKERTLEQCLRTLPWERVWRSRTQRFATGSCRHASLWSGRVPGVRVHRRSDALLPLRTAGQRTRSSRRFALSLLKCWGCRSVPRSVWAGRGQISLMRTSGSCSKQTRSPGMETGQHSSETLAATTRWWSTAGLCSVSHGRTSCTTRATYARSWLLWSLLHSDGVKSGVHTATPRRAVAGGRLASVVRRLTTVWA
jgi:hypothetical protein